MLVAVGLGLGIGGGLAFGLDLINTSFRDPEDLEAYLDVPVICAIPAIYTTRERIKRKIFQFFWIVVLVLSSGGILAAAVYFWRKGMIII